MAEERPGAEEEATADRFPGQPMLCAHVRSLDPHPTENLAEE